MAVGEQAHDFAGPGQHRGRILAQAQPVLHGPARILRVSKEHVGLP